MPPFAFLKGEVTFYTAVAHRDFAEVYQLQGLGLAVRELFTESGQALERQTGTERVGNISS